MEQPIMPEISENRKSVSLKDTTLMILKGFKNVGIYALATGVAVRSVVNIAGRSVMHGIYDLRYSNDESKREEKKAKATNDYFENMNKGGSTAGAILTTVDKIAHPAPPAPPTTLLTPDQMIEKSTRVEALETVKDALISETEPPFDKGNSHGQYGKC